LVLIPTSKNWPTECHFFWLFALLRTATIEVTPNAGIVSLASATRVCLTIGALTSVVYFSLFKCQRLQKDPTRMKKRKAAPKRYQASLSSFLTIGSEMGTDARAIRGWSDAEDYDLLSSTSNLAIDDNSSDDDVEILKPLSYSKLAAPPRQLSPSTPTAPLKKRKLTQQIFHSTKKDYSWIYKKASTAYEKFTNAFAVQYRQDHPTCTEKDKVIIAAGATWKREWRPLNVGAKPGSRSKQPRPQDVVKLESAIANMRGYNNSTVVSFGQMVRSRDASRDAPPDSPILVGVQATQPIASGSQTSMEMPALTSGICDLI
jgi:hypothetical protein